MIKINVESMEKELISLNKIIESYEQNCLNLFNEINFSYVYWKDPIALKYYNQISKEKENTIKFLYNLKNTTKLYTYIINSYKEIGQKITYYLENKDKIISYLNKITNQYQNIISEYDNLDTSFLNMNEKNKIFSLKNQISRAYQKYENIKNNIIKQMKKIEDTESKIKHNLNKYDSMHIDTFDFQEYL